jgi:diguanylate cyclase (GGDEF)-like protein
MRFRDLFNTNVKSSDLGERFNFLKYFTLSSIVVFLLLTGSLGIVFMTHQKNLLIDYAESSATDFAHHLTSRIFHDDLFSVLGDNTGIDVVSNSQEYRNLDKIIKQYLSEYSDIVKMKVFNKRGITIYSTDSTNIGLSNMGDKLQGALDGNVTSEFTRRMNTLKGDNSEKGNVYKYDILEIYIPIFEDNKIFGNDINVLGAFELYKDVSMAFYQAKGGGYILLALLVLGMITLYLVLQLIVKKADKIIEKQHDEIDTYNRELEEAQYMITDSIEEVIKHGSFHVRYVNHDLLKCWEHKKCGKTECPSFESDDLRCWQNAGTFCADEVQGYFANKYGDCSMCDVFDHAFKNRMNTIGESFNNMMTLLENKHQELKEAHDRLNWLIDIDPLTQVGNRRSFQKRMENIHMLSLRYKRPYSIIICDIDNFKLYNDTYGHQQGDYALVTISKTLKDQLRQTDEVFRWGGEEFVIILPEQNHSRGLRIAEHLRVSIQSLALESKYCDFQVVTMSFGIASSSEDNVKYISWETVLKEADDQLLRAKDEGKNCVYPNLKKKTIDTA